MNARDDLDWNEIKRAETKAARGLDFADVADLDWDTALTAEDDRKDYPETRYITVGIIHGRLCVIAWCWRETKMRIISLRKANTREERRYEQALADP